MRINKRDNASLLSWILVLCLVFIPMGMLNLPTNAEENRDNYIVSNEKNNNFRCMIAERINVSLETNRFCFSNEEAIIVSYVVESEDDITDISYSQEGFIVISLGVASDLPNRVVVELESVDSFEKHSMSIQITLSSGDTTNVSLYAISNEYGTFISPFSEDDACRKYLDYVLELGIITQDEYDNLKTELNRKGVVENTMIEEDGESNENASTRSILNGTVHFKGKLMWVDDNDRPHPLRHVMVKIYTKDNLGLGLNCIATTYSNNEGDYNYIFNRNSIYFQRFENGGCAIFIRVYAGDYNIMVKDGGGNDYYTENFTGFNVKIGTTITHDYTIDMSGDIGRAFQISQAIITARDYAEEMMGEMPLDVSVMYPGADTVYEFGESACISIENENSINSKLPHSYASWDVIMHEYGHHIALQIGIDGIPDIPYEHHVDDNLIDTQHNKDIGIKIAWAEAWPTVLGMQAQNYYSQYLQDIDYINEGNYDAYNFYHSESVEDSGRNYGEGGEFAIICVLWDLFDDQNIRYDEEAGWVDTNDKITLGHEAYWAVTTESGCTTFSEFINHFYDVYPEYTEDIGYSLSCFGMATTKPEISSSDSISNTTPPFFEWYAQGGSRDFPNNKFSLLFYDSEGEEILRIDEIDSAIDPETGITQSRQLTQNEWNMILYNSTDTFTVAVAAFSKCENEALEYLIPTTGAYISEFSGSYVNPNAHNVQYSGSITNKLRWSILTDGTLVVYGSGPMPINGVHGAWNEYKDSITNIVITGATSICSDAFSDFDNVTNVYISDTVTKIGSSAFRGCTSLVEAEFEALAGWMVWVMVSDVYIDPYELVFPDIAADYLVSYYDDREWTRDTTVTTTLSVLKRGSCGKGVYWILTSENELIIYGKGCMPSYTSVTVDGVAVTTAPWAEYADLFTTLRIGEGIYSIGRCAFYNMDNITAVYLPESLMVIEEYAFYDCAGFANFHIPAKVFSIGAYTMRRTAVTTLTLGSPLGWSVNGIELSGDADEFYAHISGAKVDGVTLSSYKFVFKHEDITDGVFIANGKFANNTMEWSINDKGLLVITGSGAMPEFSTDETPWVDYKSIIRYVSIGEGITTVGRCSFFDCFNLEGVTFSSTVVSINEYAFVDCTSLTEIDIPSTVTSIAENAFDGAGVTVEPTV